MENPLISVIIPIYNVEKYLDKCISSVVGQTYSNLEIILIDDGSPDACPQMCDNYAKNDARIKVIHKNNEGLAAARNAGLNVATGDYIAFVDSDDWIEPILYEEMLKLANKGKAEIICCGAVKLRGENKTEKCFCYYPTGTVCDSDEIVKDILLDKIGSQVCFRLYESKCWDNLRFPEGRLYEDIPTTFKAFLKAKRIGFIAEPYYNYRINKASISFILNPLKPYHIFLGFKEHYDFAMKHFPEIAVICCAKTAHYAISTYFNYYSTGEGKIYLALSDVTEFLMENKEIIKKHKSIIPYTRGLALTAFYLSPSLFKVFCKIFGKSLIKIRSSIKSKKYSI